MTAGASFGDITDVWVAAVEYDEHAHTVAAHPAKYTIEVGETTSMSHLVNQIASNHVAYAEPVAPAHHSTVNSAPHVVSLSGSELTGVSPGTSTFTVTYHISSIAEEQPRYLTDTFEIVVVAVRQSSGSGSSSGGGSSPDGDNSHIGIYIAIVILLPAAFGAVLFIRKRRRIKTQGK